LLQFRDAGGGVEHLAHLLQLLGGTAQLAAAGQGLAVLALQIGCGQQGNQEHIAERHGHRQPGGEATTLFQQWILGIEAGGQMQQPQADQGEG